MIRLLAISGSLRAASSNTAVLVAAGKLAPSGVEIVLSDESRILPHFDADLDTDTPPAPVARLRSTVGSCDGLIVSVPEYAHGLPGSFKNLLDWLVGSTTFAGTMIAIMNTSPRAEHAPAQLREVLKTMAARLVEEASITLPMEGRSWNADTIVDDPAMAQQIRRAVSNLVDVIATGNRV